MNDPDTGPGIDIDTLVKNFARDLDQLDDIDLDELDELAGGTGGPGGFSGGGDGGGGDEGDDDFDEERFYQELSERLSKKLTKEEEEKLILSTGFALDRLPFSPYGHAIRMFIFANGHLMRRTSEKSRTGEWIMYRETTGTWRTEAVDDLIINRALLVAFMLRNWSRQISQMLNDSVHLSEAKTMVLGKLAMILQSEADAVQKQTTPIIRMARSIEKYHINEKRFDIDPMKLAVSNGVLDLRTGSLISHSPTNYITRHISLAYVPNAKCPSWLTFMEQAIPDPDVRNWVQRFAGYCLTGDVEEMVAPFFHGTGGSGKSTLWKIISRNILGNHFASQVHRGVFHRGDFTRYASSTIVGLRLGVDSEWENDEVLMTGKFRQLVGEPAHTPEPKMQRILGEVPLTAKFVFLGQRMPSWDATDPDTTSAMERRIFPIPMNQKLAKEAYKSSAYLELIPRLVAEREGILAWMVEGELMRHAQPLHFNEPQAITTDREAYLKTLGAIIIDPIEEALTRAGYRLDPALKASAKDIIDDTGIEKTALGNWLRKHRVTVKDRKVNGVRGAWYEGIGRPV